MKFKNKHDLNFGVDLIPVDCNCDAYFNTKTKKYECLLSMPNKGNTTYVFMLENIVHIE